MALSRKKILFSIKKKQTYSQKPKWLFQIRHIAVKALAIFKREGLHFEISFASIVIHTEFGNSNLHFPSGKKCLQTPLAMKYTEGTCVPDEA